MARLQTVPPPKPEQMAALTGLRGFAALWVAALHFQGETNLLLPASVGLNWFIGAGANAVPLFFVLSGFILLHTYRDQFENFSWRAYFGFLGLRLARIYPAYLAALAAMVLLVVAAALAGVPHNDKAYPANWLLPEALMLHCWGRLPPNFFGWNFPDWSVSAEWFAYLCIFPLAVWLRKKICRLAEIIPLLAALGLCVLEPVIRTEWKLPMVSLLFLAGALLWEWRRRKIAAGNLPAHLDAAGVLLLLAVLGGGWREKIFTDAGVLVAIALIILGLSRADGIFSRLLAARAWVFLGELSYSLYLVHGLVQRLLKIALPAEKFSATAWPVRAGVAAMEFSAVLLAAALLYWLVEKPARGWLRRKFSGRQT